MSRHEVPKTAGNDDAFKIYDPARVSHLPVSQSVRRPSGVVGSLAMLDPRVVGATPLDPVLKSGHPCRGASYPTLHDELNSFCTAQMRQPCPLRSRLFLIPILEWILPRCCSITKTTFGKANFDPKTTFGKAILYLCGITNQFFCLWISRLSSP